MNSIQILGRLTRDPELKYLQTGKAICNCSLAVNRNKEEADFFECVSFEKTAETLSNYVKKGQRILIDGRLQQDRWKDQQSGENRSTVKIIINRFDFIESASDQPSNTRQQPSQPAPQPAPQGFNPSQPQPPMNGRPPAPYGQPQAPYSGGPYAQPQQQPPVSGYMPPNWMPPMPQNAPPSPQNMPQQQGFWLGGNQQPGTPVDVNQFGHEVPMNQKDIPF